MCGSPEVGKRYLAEALDRMMYYVLLRVEPNRDKVLILQSRNRPDRENTWMSWSKYLELCSGILSPKNRELLYQRLSCASLIKAAQMAEESFTLDIPYSRRGENNWLTVTTMLQSSGEGESCAYIFVRQTNDVHLLRSIIDLFVYNSCDYFIYLDAKKNSYVMFSGSTNGTPLPPAVCDDYETALVDYAREFVVPEDQEYTIEQMRIGRVLEQLEEKGVHSFTVGVLEEKRGYTRKRLEYRYYDRDTQMILLTRTDVTDIYLEEKARNQELLKAQRQAEQDPLTGLLNYGGLQQHLGNSMGEEMGPSALLFIDLDDFKSVNDTFGHQAGDTILCAVARAMERELQKRDICGRIGGDEFIAYLPEVRERVAAEDCARRLCERIGNIRLLDGRPISCSIGIAFSPEDGCDYAALVYAADKRVYIAKARGKNQYFTG